MDTLIQQIYTATILFGGTTRSTIAPYFKPTSGYSVARAGRELQVSEDAFNASVVDNFINSNKHLLNDARVHVGTWLDNGIVYLDVVDVVQDKETAIRQGIANNQLSIYDNNRCEVIDMPPTQTAGTHTQQRMYTDMKVQELVEA